MFVTGGEFLDRVYMRAALVRESCRAHPWLARIMANIGDLIDELRKLLELRERTNRHRIFLQLEREIGNDTGQIAIAGPFAIPIHRALDVCRTDLDGGERVGHSKPNVVVRVDADPDVQFSKGNFCDAPYFARQTATIGIAKDNKVCTCFLSR